MTLLKPMIVSSRKLWFQLIRQHLLKKEGKNSFHKCFDGDISETIKNCDQLLKKFGKSRLDID